MNKTTVMDDLYENPIFLMAFWTSELNMNTQQSCLPLCLPFRLHLHHLIFPFFFPPFFFLRFSQDVVHPIHIDRFIDLDMFGKRLFYAIPSRRSIGRFGKT